MARQGAILKRHLLILVAVVAAILTVPVAGSRVALAASPGCALIASFNGTTQNGASMIGFFFAGETVTISASGPFNVSVSPGTKQVSNVTSFSHTFPASGVYSVSALSSNTITFTITCGPAA